MKRRSIGVRASFDTERIVAADGRVNFGLAAIQSHGLLDLPSLAEPIDAPHAILLYLEILFASPTRVTSSALSNHVSKQTPSIQPELSGGSEFYRDNRESETTNFPNSSHHPLPFLSLSLFILSFLSSSRHPLLFQCLRVHFLPRGAGPDTGPLGKGDPKFSGGRFWLSRG